MSSKTEYLRMLDAKIKCCEDALERRGDFAKREDMQVIRDKIAEMKAEKKSMEEDLDGNSET